MLNLCFELILTLILSLFLLFLFKSTRKRVQFTSFDYKVLCLTFRRNLWVLIERMVLGMNYKEKQRSNEAPEPK